MPPRTKGFDTPQLAKLRSAIDNGTGRPTLCDASGAKRKILIKDNGYTTGRGGAVFRHGKEIIADDDNGDIRLGREGASLANGMAAEAGKILLEIDLGVIVQSLTELYWLSAETEARLPGIVRRAVVEELMARNNTNSATAAVDAAAAPNVLGRRNLLPSFDATGAAAAGAGATVIQPSPTGTVAPPTVVPLLQQMQAEITTNTKNQLVTAEIQQQSALAHKMILGKLEGVDATLEEHGGDIATLKDQVGHLSGRVNALELKTPTAAAASGAAFSFDGADPGSNQKRPALPSTNAIGSPRGAAASSLFGGAGAASVASAPGGGFDSRSAAAATTTAGFLSQGNADTGTVAVTTAGPGSNKKQSVRFNSDALATAASLKSSSDGSILTLGAVAGSAGAGAGINGAGFFFNGPTAGSFGTPKNSALSAAPSGSFGTQESSPKDAVGFQQVSIDAVNIILKQAEIAQSIGGAESFDFKYWDMKDSILQFVKEKQALLAQSSEKQLWIYQSSEALDKVTHVDIIETIGSHDVPVFVFTLCELPPTTFVATNSLQLQQRAFYSLQEKNLWWKEVSPRVYILQATPIAFGQLLDYEYTLFPIMKPSKLYGKETDKSLESVDVIHNGVLIGASKVSDVDAALEDEKDEAEDEGREPRITSDDRPDIVAKLKEKKREQEGLNLSLLENHTSHYHGMIVSHAKLHNIGLSEAASKMESMEMYKIYPSNLPPPKTWDYFQPTGFRKNTMVNRFSGNCDGYYPK